MVKLKKIKTPKWCFYYWGNGFMTWIPIFRNTPLIWKDKNETPRCEVPPTIEFTWLWFSLMWRRGDDEFWEQWLWVYKYCDGDIIKAEETWPWVNYHNSESSWKNFNDLV